MSLKNNVLELVLSLASLNAFAQPQVHDQPKKVEKTQTEYVMELIRNSRTFVRGSNDWKNCIIFDWEETGYLRDFSPRELMKAGTVVVEYPGSPAYGGVAAYVAALAHYNNLGYLVGYETMRSGFFQMTRNGNDMVIRSTITDTQVRTITDDELEVAEEQVAHINQNPVQSKEDDHTVCNYTMAAFLKKSKLHINATVECTSRMSAEEFLKELKNLKND